MKTLVAIWVAALLSGAGTVVYVDKSINDHIAQQYNPQQTISGEVLQPAAKVNPNFTVTHNPQQTINGKDLQGN